MGEGEGGRGREREREREREGERETVLLCSHMQKPTVWWTPSKNSLLWKLLQDFKKHVLY